MSRKDRRNRLSDSGIFLLLKRFFKSVWSIISNSKLKENNIAQHKELDVDCGTAKKTDDEVAVEKIVLPSDVEQALKAVDWSVRDVLVGSLGSVEQLKDNLARRYYFVPAANVYQDASHIRYIALYQSLNMFGDNCGIQYYGEVTQMKRVRRKSIPFPIRRNNGEEWYYAFYVKKWYNLPNAIYVKDEGVYKPKYTNIFLLHNCEQSYELFSVRSEEQFRLLCALKQMQDDFIMKGKTKKLYQVSESKSVCTQDDSFNVVNNCGEKLIDASFKIVDFANHPKIIYDYIKGKVYV